MRKRPSSCYLLVRGISTGGDISCVFSAAVQLSVTESIQCRFCYDQSLNIFRLRSSRDKKSFAATFRKSGVVLGFKFITGNWAMRIQMAKHQSTIRTLLNPVTVRFYSALLDASGLQITKVFYLSGVAPTRRDPHIICRRFFNFGLIIFDCRLAIRPNPWAQSFRTWPIFNDRRCWI